MNELVSEWTTKADADFATATREAAVNSNANHDAVCFHAQQCVEKLMKAVLIELGELPPKIHDLAHLHALLVPLTDRWTWPLEELHFLSRAAVEFRYPGESADVEDATLALDICRRMREKLKSVLKTDETPEV